MKIYERTQPILKGENNFWYRTKNSDVVIVFVHGIFSDSRDCWTAKNQTVPVGELYWPDLIGKDTRLGDLNIFMGGFFTAIDANSYDFFDCSKELFSALGRLDEFQNPTVLSFSKIVFVCHSTGGIVARHMLFKQQRAFQDKEVGLVLIASPSSGSELASALDGLASIYNSKLAQQLTVDSEAIKDIDKNFKDLVHDDNRPFTLIGVEAYENRFIIHRKWFPDRIRVVTEASAGKYFGAPVQLPATDHFSAVKPTRATDPQHTLFVDFLKRFRESTLHRKGSQFGVTTIGNVSNGGADVVVDKGQQEPLLIRFLGAFDADPVDVANLLELSKQNQKPLIQICWPESLEKIAAYLRSMLAEAGARPRTARFASAKPDDTANFVTGATAALKHLDKTYARALRRLPILIQSVVSKHHISISHDFAPARSAVCNFLALAVFRAGEQVAYWASWEPVRVDAMLEPWMEILLSNNQFESFRILFKRDEEVVYARVASVGNFVFSGGRPYGYLYGPHSAVMECSGTYTRMFPRYRWYCQWLIPQVEMELAECEDLSPIDYDESIVPAGVVKNASGEEL